MQRPQEIVILREPLFQSSNEHKRIIHQQVSSVAERGGRNGPLSMAFLVASRGETGTLISILNCCYHFRMFWNLKAINLQVLNSSQINTALRVVRCLKRRATSHSIASSAVKVLEVAVLHHHSLSASAQTMSKSSSFNLLPSSLCTPAYRWLPCHPPHQFKTLPVCRAWGSRSLGRHLLAQSPCS